MIVEILVLTFVGILGGVFAGLMPGIHPNTLIILLFGFLPLLSGYPVEALVALIISMVVTNTLISFIPAVFLGAPESETALSTLPGHRLLLQGRGLEAIYLTVIGGVGVVTLFVLTLPIMINVLPFVYDSIKSYIPYLLIAIAAVMIFTEKGFQKIWAIVVFILSGILGMIVLNSFLLQPEHVFFPLFTGLFGTSTLLLSLNSKTKLANQNKSFGIVERSVAVMGSIKGFLSGLIVGILPAVGSAQAGILVQILTRRQDNREFLVSLGGINTAQTLFALVALYAIGKPRSGAAVAIERLVENFGFNELVLLTGVSLLATGIGVIITLFLSKKFLSLLEIVPYGKLSLSVIIMLVLLTATFTGIFGLLILFVSTAIGLIAPLTNVKRSLLMGVLILPTVLFYLGIII